MCGKFKKIFIRAFFIGFRYEKGDEQNLYELKILQQTFAINFKNDF